jgi:hypothetical protein
MLMQDVSLVGRHMGAGGPGMFPLATWRMSDAQIRAVRMVTMGSNSALQFKRSLLVRSCSGVCHQGRLQARGVPLGACEIS